MLYATFEEEVVKLKDVQGFEAKLATQFLPHTTGQTPENINCLGLSSDQDAGPLILMSYVWSYELSKDERIVEDTATHCFNRMEAKAKEMDVWHPFQYMNYADENIQAEDVWEGYGAANLARLRKIQKSIDPTGVFTRGGLASGYFKIPSCRHCKI